MISLPRPRLVLAAALLGLLAHVAAYSPASAQASCAPDIAARGWLRGALDAWDGVRRDALRIADASLPRMVVFDSGCVWDVPGSREAAASGGAVRGTLHDGTIRTPDGGELPPVLTSFASAYGPERRPFLVFALPEIWLREPRHREDARIDALLRSVFVHEMTHASQTAVIAPLLDRVSSLLPDPDDLDDDIIQTRFEGDARFRAAYERERDVLYEAAREPDPERRARLAADARDAISARRAEFFTGDAAIYRELEDVFLVMEGAANWAAYAAARAGGLDSRESLALIRRDGRRWSQDEGLALFLLLEAQQTAWRDAVFGRTPPPVEALLDAAARPD